jgi:hypothetical protein
MFLKQKFANFLALNSIRMGGNLNSTWQRNPSCDCKLIHMCVWKEFFFEFNTITLEFECPLLVKNNIQEEFIGQHMHFLPMINEFHYK